MRDNVHMPSGRAAATVFYIINVLLFPITLIGYVIRLARIYLARRASDASITAQGSLSARSFMHALGLRRDDAAYRLLMALPSTSGFAVLLTGGPMLLAPPPDRLRAERLPISVQRRGSLHHSKPPPA